MPPEDTSPFGIDWKIACGPKYVFSVAWKEFAITTVLPFSTSRSNAPGLTNNDMM